MGLTWIVILATIGFVANAYFTLKWFEKRWAAKEPLSPEEHDRIFTHEIGHVVVAWYSSSVTSVDGVERTKRGAQTLFEMKRSEDPRSLRELIAIYMAGAAAEQLCFDHVEWAGCETDLKKGREKARQLKAEETLEESKKRYRKYVPPTTDAWPLTLTDDDDSGGHAAMILALGIIDAYALIMANRAGFDRLREIVRSRRDDGKIILTREDIEATLGPRPWAV